METQPQKYNGENTYNNSVEIDFKKREVHFSPIKGNRKKYSYLFDISNNVRSILASVFYLGIGVCMFRDYVNHLGIMQQTSIRLIGMLAVLLIFLPLIIPLIFIPKYIKDNYFSKLMALLIIIREGIKGRVAKTKGTVNKEMIIDNKYIIEEFDNVMLKYKLTGDMAKKIKKIRIINKFTDNPYKWKAIFEFKKGIKNGDLWVNYI